MAPRWERGRELLWRPTAPVSHWLVHRLAPQQGQTILELSAGLGETGFLAAPFLGPRGQLISSDRELGMVEAAARLGSERGIANAEFRQLDAERIQLPDASVDGVLSRFGYILKGDPPPALAEIRRVLRPGGRLAFSVWAARERNAWMTVPAEALVARGHLASQTDAEARLSARRNPESIAAAVTAAGFGESEIEEMPITYRFKDADELWFFVSELRGPVALALADLPEAERAEIRAEIESRASLGDGYELGGVSLNVAVA
jgi:SAM-dependent methyltransferase